MHFLAGYFKSITYIVHAYATEENCSGTSTDVSPLEFEIEPKTIN
jgi:hypothetical protein